MRGRKWRGRWRRFRGLAGWEWRFGYWGCGIWRRVDVCSMRAARSRMIVWMGMVGVRGEWNCCGRIGELELER